MTLTGLRRLAVAVVDDEPPAVDELCYLLGQHECIDVVARCGDANEALRVFDSVAVDAIFMDISMPGLDGLSLARVLQRFATPPAIVFVTAHQQHAVEAFEMRAVDYLLKPLRSDRVGEALRRIRSSFPERPGAVGGETVDADDRRPEIRTRVPVETGGRLQFVERDDVIAVEASRDYVKLHTADRSYLVRTPISTLEAEWASVGFVRVHRGYLVALRYVQELRSAAGQNLVALVGPPGASHHWREIPVSRAHSRELRERLIAARR